MAVKLTETRYGRVIYFDTDGYFRVLLEKYGEYCEGEAELFRRVLQPGDLAVDVGANIGMHTLAMAQLVGPSGIVLAFEPQPPIYYALCGNLALGEHWRVVAHPCALGAQQGTTRIPAIDYSQRGSFGGVSTGVAEGLEVPVKTLDSFELPHCKLIKIDVEGNEVAVLAGARETIARCRPVLLAENDRGENSRELTAAMLGMDYRLFWYTPLLVNAANNWRSYKIDHLPGVAAMMLLGIPSEARISEHIGLDEIFEPQDTRVTGYFDVSQLDDVT